MKAKLKIIATAAFIAGVITGCSDSSGTAAGVISVRLTDAPFPFSDITAVQVYVVRVDARRGTATDAEVEDESNGEGWTTIATPNSLINLLDLAGGRTTNLGAATLASGTYNGFRLIIDPTRSLLTLADGSHPDVKFPSAGHSGLKVQLDKPIEVTRDGSVITLDFDVGR
ncbi:MAG TPA: DUF4382 domain-containing protein, partial [Gemmatimonadaceae bacterium]